MVVAQGSLVDPISASALEHKAARDRTCTTSRGRQLVYYFNALDTLKTRLQAPQGFVKAGGFHGVISSSPVKPALTSSRRLGRDGLWSMGGRDDAYAIDDAAGGASAAVAPRR